MDLKVGRALLVAACVLLGGAESGEDGQWTRIEGASFAPQVVGDVRLSGCQFTWQFSAKLNRLSAQVACMASNASPIKQDRTLFVEFVIRHKGSDGAWFSETVDGFVLPGSGAETRLVANNGWLFWDSSKDKADPDPAAIRVNVVVRTSVFYGAEALKPLTRLH